MTSQSDISQMSAPLKANDCLVAVVDGSRIRLESKLPEGEKYLDRGLIAEILQISAADVDLRPVGRHYNDEYDECYSFVNSYGDLILGSVCGDAGLTPEDAERIVTQLQEVLDQLNADKLRQAAQEWVDKFNA